MLATPQIFQQVSTPHRRPFGVSHPPTPARPWLQSPLQPLMDNLESQTYETFERDATK